MGNHVLHHGHINRRQWVNKTDHDPAEGCLGVQRQFVHGLEEGIQARKASRVPSDQDEGRIG